LPNWTAVKSGCAPEILTPDGQEVERIDTRFAADDLDTPRRLAAHLLDCANPALRALFSGWSQSS
jgi:hypothetical protein